MKTPMWDSTHFIPHWADKIENEIKPRVSCFYINTLSIPQISIKTFHLFIPFVMCEHGCNEYFFLLIFTLLWHRAWLTNYICGQLWSHFLPCLCLNPRHIHEEEGRQSWRTVRCKLVYTCTLAKTCYFSFNTCTHTSFEYCCFQGPSALRCFPHFRQTERQSARLSFGLQSGRTPLRASFRHLEPLRGTVIISQTSHGDKNLIRE